MTLGKQAQPGEAKQTNRNLAWFNLSKTTNAFTPLMSKRIPKLM